MKSLVLAIFLVASSLLSAELKVIGEPQRDQFVTISSEASGRWVVIGPTTITVKKTAEANGVALGQSSINFRRTIVTEEGKQCHWVGPPGNYAVIQFVAEDPEPSHIVVSIPGEVKDDNDVPDPNPSGVVRLVIVRETAQSTIEKQKMFAQIRNEYKAKPILILDQDSSTAATQPFVQASQGKQLPVVCLIDGDGKILTTKAFNTYQQFLEAVK